MFSLTAMRTLTIVLLVGLVVGCAPAAPPSASGGPTRPAEPAKPAEAAKPAAPVATSAPAAPAKPAEKPADAAKPAPPAAKPADAPKADKPAGAAKPAAPASGGPQGDKLVVAVAGWSAENPWAWKSNQSDKALWDVIYDSLIMRDPKTFELIPGLATEWKPSADYKSWTFKLRQGIKFHGDWGEMTSEDVRFTVEMNLKPTSLGGSAAFLREKLASIDTPDKYTIVFNFKEALWEVPYHFSQFVGYQNITSKKHLEAVGEEKALLNPVGTGPYRHVEAVQGAWHRFEAVPNHWRQTPYYKELIIRRIPDPATALSGVRSGEIDIASVTGDFLKQAKSAGLRVFESKNAVQFWASLPGQSVPKYEDYCPQCPWVGDPNDPKAQENALKVRLGLNLAVNKQAIVDGLWQGYGALIPYTYWYYPFMKGYSTEWKIPPYDPQRARQLFAEAGYPNGFEIRMNMIGQNVDGGNDIMEVVAQDWEKVGVKVVRVNEDFATFSPKGRQRKTGVVGRLYSSPSARDEASLTWLIGIHTKGTFNLLAEGPYDAKLDAIATELDLEKRTRLTVELGDQLYREYRGVLVGMRSATWAVSRKVGTWPALPWTNIATNFESITP